MSTIQVELNESDRLNVHKTSQGVYPNWLTTHFFTEHLQRHYNDSELKVIKFEAQPIPAQGDNFLSSLYRACVVFSTNVHQIRQTSTLDLIIKIALPDENALDVSLQQKMYDKEMEFYAEIAQKINQKLRELDEPQLLAQCFGVCKSRKIMILEDLSANGYSVLPVQSGYSISQTKIILKRLATFHAVCAVLQEVEPNIFEHFKTGGHFSRDMSTFDNIYLGNLDAAAEIISDWPEYVNYAVKMRNLRSDLMERVRRNYDVQPDHFNTLNHDDLWCPNLMLTMSDTSETEDKPIENVIFIDFQFVYWASPATDLHFLLATSIDESLRPYHFYELVQFYHKQLVGYLERLNYEQHIPIWMEFEAQYQERCFTAFVVSCLMLPVFAHNIDNLSMNQLVLNDEKGMALKRKLYQQENVQAILRKMIPYFDRMRIFD